MAFFERNIDRVRYENQICRDCIHFGREESCSILGIHLLYNDEPEKREVLDMLIPMKNNYPSLCSLYHSKEESKGK